MSLGIRWRAFGPALLLLLALLTAALLPAPASAAPAGGPDPSLGLTEAERAWLEAHPRPRVFTKIEWAPIDLYAYEGRFRGLSGDYLALVAQRLGVQFEFHPMPTLADALEALRAGRADILPSVSRTPQREAFMAFTRPYLDVPNIYVSRHGVAGVGPEEPMAGLRVAAERGYAVIGLIRERHPRARVVEFADSASALRGVSEGDADVYLGALPTTGFLVERLLLTNLEVRGRLRSDLSALHLGVRRDAVELRSILDKALASITLAERQEIHRRWAPLQSMLAEPSPPLALADEDKALLSAMAPLRIGYESDFRPYSFVGDDGAASGMAFEYLRLAADKLGLPLARPQPGPWSEVLARARGGDIDLLVAVARNEERQRDFEFIGPWMSTPNVLITPRTAPPVLSLADFDRGSRGPVAVLRDGQTAWLMRRLHPRVPLLEVANRDELLASVANGQAGGAFINATLAAPRLAQGLGATLKLAGFFPELNSDLYFAVRREQADVARLLRRALASIGESERAAINSRWAVLPAPDEDNAQLRGLLRRLLPLLALLGTALVVALLWGLTLRREVARRRMAESALGIERDRAQRLAQQRRAFIDEASHEIRTPVNAVVGALGQLQAQPLPPAARELTGLARRAAQTLSEYINNLLDLSRSEAGALQLVEQPDSLAATLRAAVEAIEPVATPRGLAITLALDSALARAHRIDAFRLHQVILNLLSNAVRFSDAGTVRVEARVLGQEPGFQDVEISVADEGRGIDPAAIGRLFEPFVQAGDSRIHREGGSGLGLALCRRLVLAMGGRLQLEAAEPLGTRAIVGLRLAVAASSVAPVESASGRPAAADVTGPAAAKSDAGRGTIAGDATSDGRGAAPVTASAAITGQPPSGHGEERLRTLVVEDDRVQQILLETMLTAAGCAVELAGSAEEAQRRWRADAHALVLTDLQLPGRSGRDFARWLRAQPGGDRVRLIGTSADLESAGDVGAAGIDRLLHKPVAPALIHELVGSLRNSPPIATTQA